MIGKMTLAGLVVGALMAGALPAQSPAQAAPAMTEQTETYDLLFRNGTLDGVSDPLRYTRDVENSANPEAASRDSGELRIGFEGEEGAETPRKAVLSFHQGDKMRNLGSFPASVGNPLIMVFVESVIRDMAETAGGSPFYIRNRVKEALVQPAELEAGEIELNGRQVAAQTVTLRPFKDDPNVARMQGFGDLALIVTMSPEVPGWYHSLTARIEAPDGGESAYSSELSFAGTGEAR